MAGKNQKNEKNEYMRKLPSVDEVMRTAESNQYARTMLLRAVQELISERRERIAASSDPALLEDGFYRIEKADIEKKCAAFSTPGLQRVINATGIIVHTNLGRSPLSRQACRDVAAIADCYSNLEFNLAAGKRGSRSEHIEQLLVRLTGAEAGFAVNNNAAAVLLCLAALARGAEVVVSRGELVEIGGSFRIPDVMEQSGARLVEVGTTNRTHAADYRDAISPHTALLFKAHPSNYRILGFTADVCLDELVAIGQQHGLPVLFDLGSGCVMDSQRLGIGQELTVQQAVKSGADIVTFSGDKLLGGPQAGLIVGRAPVVERIRKHPLARALRIDKLTLAALSATLRTYVFEPEQVASIPVIGMLMASSDSLLVRARAIARALEPVLPSGAVFVEQAGSQVGGGSCPLQELPTWVVSIDPGPMLVERIDELLRSGSPAVVGRISRDRMIFDVRTLMPEEDGLLVEAVKKALQ